MTAKGKGGAPREGRKVGNIEQAKGGGKEDIAKRSIAKRRIPSQNRTLPESLLKKEGHKGKGRGGTFKHAHRRVLYGTLFLSKKIQ